MPDDTDPAQPPPLPALPDAIAAWRTAELQRLSLVAAMAGLNTACVAARAAVKTGIGALLAGQPGPDFLALGAAIGEALAAHTAGQAAIDAAQLASDQALGVVSQVVAGALGATATADGVLEILQEIIAEAG